MAEGDSIFAIGLLASLTGEVVNGLVWGIAGYAIFRPLGDGRARWWLAALLTALTHMIVDLGNAGAIIATVVRVGQFPCTAGSPVPCSAFVFPRVMEVLFVIVGFRLGQVLL